MQGVLHSNKELPHSSADQIEHSEMMQQVTQGQKGEQVFLRTKWLEIAEKVQQRIHVEKAILVRSLCFT
jgi:hypothetical protein